VCKWYKHDDNMKHLSALYPDVTFYLDGEGEEQGDVWEKVYENGKLIRHRKAQIVMVDQEV
jgi:hypothetical protein